MGAMRILVLFFRGVLRNRSELTAENLALRRQVPIRTDETRKSHLPPQLITDSLPFAATHQTLTYHNQAGWRFRDGHRFAFHDEYEKFESGIDDALLPLKGPRT